MLLEIKTLLNENMAMAVIIIAFVSYLYYYVNNIKKFPRGPMPPPITWECVA